MKTNQLCFLLLFPILLWAQMPEKSGPASPRSIPSVAGLPAYSAINVNGITSWTGASGSSNHSPTGRDGTYFPRKTGPVVYQDGIVWGAKIFNSAFEASGTPADTQSIRVGGNLWAVGLSTAAGYVTGLGPTAVAISPTNPRARVYRIRRDYRTMTAEELTRDAADMNEIADTAATNAQRDSIKARYEQDWVNWPIDLGAPYIERNGVPGYQAPPPFDSSFTADSLLGKYDEPGVAGDPDAPADQVLWTVFNDLDTALSRKIAGSLPLGLEIRKTIWAYKSATLDNVYFTRHEITNKGGVDTSAAAGDQKGAFWLDSMFVAQWVDMDLGAANDDLLGCDSTAGLGFAYNANATDLSFTPFGLAPSALAYRVVAGPIQFTNGSDTAFYGSHRIPKYKNIGMSAFCYYASATPYSESGFSDYNVGTSRWWKVLNGYAPVGTFSDPPQKYGFLWPFTRFQFSGDPIAGTGRLDGLGTPDSPAPGERRMVLVTGPISLAPGQTNEVVIAFAAGNGADRLSSLTLAKTAAEQARQMFESGFRSVVTEVQKQTAGVVPARFELSQNYPNPFNPETEIRYQIPAYAGTEVRGQTSEVSRVRLAVYDLLGREVATLVDETLPAGRHRAIWNASGNSSGIYFLRLESGGLVETKKMVLVR